VSDYLIGVYSNLVYIEDGELNIQNRKNQKLQGYFETNFTFTLTDFTLDSASVKKSDKFFFATNFDLEFTDYQMQLVDDLHKLAMGKVVISSMEKEVLIENLDLHPVSRNITSNTMKDYNRSELYNISVPKIKLLGVNLNNAFFNNKLKIADFKIPFFVVPGFF